MARHDADNRDDWLRALPEAIATAVERGWVARVPPTLSPDGQRLLATLGIPVMFVEDAPEPDLDRLDVATRRRPAGNGLQSELLRGRRPTGSTLWERILTLLGDQKPRALGEVWRDLGKVDSYTEVSHELRRMTADVLIVRIGKPGNSRYRIAS